MEPRGGRIIGCTLFRGSRGFPGFLWSMFPSQGDLSSRRWRRDWSSKVDQENSSSVFGEVTRSALLLGGGCAGLSVTTLRALAGA